VALKLVFARRGKPAVTNAGSIQTDAQQRYRCTEDKRSALLCSIASSLSWASTPRRSPGFVSYPGCRPLASNRSRHFGAIAGCRRTLQALSE
jgi:hypothetical protein